MKRLLTWMIGALSGAAAMYLFDPRGGSRRRALMRDQAVHLKHEATGSVDTVGGVAKQVQDRTKGMIAETKSMLHDEPVSDEVLVARVRSEMGRTVSNAGAIDVTAHQGIVTISGAVLAAELDKLLATVKAVRGVKEVNNLLRIYGQVNEM